MATDLNPRGMYWHYAPEWPAWWLMVPSDGTTAKRGYGPFNATEAAWAAKIYGVPFDAASAVDPPEQDRENHTRKRGETAP